MENGERAIESWKAKLAGALCCDESDLIGSFSTNVTGTIPIVGYVGAGAEVFPIDDHNKGEGMDRIECPREIDPAKGVAVEVRGDSMEPLIGEGDVLFYNERFPGVPAEFLNKRCVVWLHDGKCLVKKIRKGKQVGHYNLESLNPKDAGIENVLVQYSAFIKTWIQR